MAEAAGGARHAKPHEMLLVADALTGQDAVNLARAFDEKVGITGIVLTRIDGDGRGGAALSMRAVTGKPIKLIGTGEKLDGLEDFHPERIAGRILGMGDIVWLVEKAAHNIDQDEGQEDRRAHAQGRVRPRRPRRPAEAAAEAGRHGRRDEHAARHGQDQEADGRPRPRQQGVEAPDRHHRLDDAYERRNPKVMDAKRKKRMAAGSGTKVEEVNRLLKMHRQMAGMMKQMGPARACSARCSGGKGGPSGRNREDAKGTRRPGPEALPEESEGDGEGRRCRGRRTCRHSGPGGPKLPGLGGLPGMGGGLPFKGFPGPGKKK